MDELKVSKIRLASIACSLLSLLSTIYIIYLVINIGLNKLVAYLFSFVLGGVLQFVIYIMTSALFIGYEQKNRWLIIFSFICLAIDFSFSLGGLIILTLPTIELLSLPFQILSFILIGLLASFITLGNEILEMYAKIIEKRIKK